MLKSTQNRQKFFSLKADRRENQPASEKQAVSDATALYEVCFFS